MAIITSRSGGCVILGAVFRQALPVDAVRSCVASVSVARRFAAPSMTRPTGNVRRYHSHHNKLLSQTASGSPSRFGCTYEPPAMSQREIAHHPCGLKPSGSFPAQTLGKDIPSADGFGIRESARKCCKPINESKCQKLNEPASAKRRAGPKSVSSNHAPILIRKSAWIFNYFLTKHLYEELH